MTLPATVNVSLRFVGGPSFGDTFVLGDPLHGVLGDNVLGTSTAKPVDITPLVQTATIRRGRTNSLSTYNNGTAVVQILDRTGDFNPDNSSSPYYGQILPNRQLRITADYNGTTYELFSGYVETWDYTFDLGFDGSAVNIIASDAFRIFNLADVDTVSGAAAGDTAGERIAQLLNTAGWPATQRRINLGGVEVQDDPGGSRSILQIAQQIERTELGAFFVDSSGRAVFETRAELSQLASTDPIVFTDTPGTVPGIEYQSIEMILSDELLANQVTVGIVGSTPETATDTASIAEYFIRSLSISDTLHATANAALGSAQAVLNNRKQVGLEVRSIEFQLVSDDSDRIEAGLTAKFGQPIRVIRSQPGGSTIDATLTIQGIEHTITPNRHDVLLTTSRPLSFAFVLGSLTYGVLGTSTL